MKRCYEGTLKRVKKEKVKNSKNIEDLMYSLLTKNEKKFFVNNKDKIDNMYNYFLNDSKTGKKYTVHLKTDLYKINEVKTYSTDYEIFSSYLIMNDDETIYFKVIFSEIGKDLIRNTVHNHFLLSLDSLLDNSLKQLISGGIKNE